MISNIAGSAIKGIMTFHPTKTEDNLDLMLTNASAEQIVKHTGIRFRKIVDKYWRFDEYVLQCVERFFQSQPIKKDNIDYLVCVTQSAGVGIPSLSFYLHDRLQFKNSACCIDVNLGCSGYVQGIQLIQSLMATDLNSEVNGLLICGDFSSQLIDSNDQSVKPIFSDAVSITHIQRAKQYDFQTSSFSIDTLGSGRHAIEMKNEPNGKLKLDGIDVFNYSLKMVPSNLRRLEESMNGPKLSQSIIFFHQANKIINDSLSRKLGLAADLPSTLHTYGNTGSATIPLTLCNYFSGNSIKSKNLFLCGFGIGFSVASGYVFFDTSVISPPQCMDL